MKYGQMGTEQKRLEARAYGSPSKPNAFPPSILLELSRHLMIDTLKTVPYSQIQK
jgi:hypothetical protein